MANVFTHSGYDNFALSVKFENLYKSKLDLMNFCTVDNSLVGVPGQKIVVHTYKATDGTEELAMGAGNTKNIEVSMTSEEKKIILLQNRFPWYDEHLQNDPNIVKEGINHMAEDMFNEANKRAMAEFAKTTLEVKTKAFDFNAFVDASALFAGYENEKPSVFAFVNKADMAAIRKSLRDDLKYVEAYARNGYVGTVAGINLYVSNIATKGTIICATKKAVKYLNKTGTQVVQERTDENTRLNTMYSRKYGVFYLADERECVKITLDPVAV